MILDMYLIGKKVCGKQKSLYSIAHWRNHPDLHNFIVQFFADGVDTCQEIELNIDNMMQIKKAIEDDDLPKTNGLFGESTVQQNLSTLKAIDIAVEWLLNQQKNEERSVIYQATW